MKANQLNNKNWNLISNLFSINWKNKFLIHYIYSKSKFSFIKSKKKKEKLRECRLKEETKFK